MPDTGTIDLGKEPQKLDKVVTESESKTYYPTLRINDVPGLDDLPEGEFTFTAKGKLASYSENLKDGTCSCEIEIHSITPVAQKSAKKSKPADERLDESLDKIAQDKADAYEEDSQD